MIMICYISVSHSLHNFFETCEWSSCKCDITAQLDSHCQLNYLAFNC